MAATTLAPESQSRVPLEQSFLLRAVDWTTYRKISEVLTGRHLRLTYDGENLEFMTISPEHGHCSRLIAQIIAVLTEEFELPRKSFGDMTCDRADLERGLEPDECFYLTHEPLIRGKNQLDFETDPPPDLAVEVDITRSSRIRMGIYAKLRVPEVWRYDGVTLRTYRLTAEESYVQVDQSGFFPGIPIGELQTFLQRRNDMDENSLIREFRDWLRDTQRVTNGGLA